MDPPYTLLPWEYSKGVPPDMSIFDGQDVAVLDYSFPLETMQDIATRAASLLWIDHHATQLPNVKPLEAMPRTTVVFDMATCGCVLTHEHVDQVSWEYKLEGVYRNRHFHEVLAAVKANDFGELTPTNRPIFDGFVTLTRHLWGVPDRSDFQIPTLDDIRTTGKYVSMAKAVRVAASVERACIVKFEWYGLAVVTCDPWDISDTGDALAAIEGVDFGVCTYMNPQGRFYHSIRSRKHNCAEFAALFGGGGHTWAAGVTADKILFIP